MTEQDLDLREAIAEARQAIRNGFWTPRIRHLRLLADAAEQVVQARTTKDAEVLAMQQQILQMLNTLTEKDTKIMREIDDLLAGVANNGDLLRSMTAYMQGLADLLKSAGTDPAKLQAIIDTLSNDDAAAATAMALLQNTPAEGLVPVPVTTDPPGSAKPSGGGSA